MENMQLTSSLIKLRKSLKGMEIGQNPYFFTWLIWQCTGLVGGLFNPKIFNQKYSLSCTVQRLFSLCTTLKNPSYSQIADVPFHSLSQRQI